MSLPAYLQIDSTTCTILRRVSSGRDDLGSPVYSWAEISTGVQCVIDPIVNRNNKVIKSDIDMALQGEVESENFRLICGSAVDIQAGDHVESSGVEYSVDAVACFSTHKEARLIL